MIRVEVVAADRLDLLQVAYNMRACDRLEIQAAQALAPLDAVTRSASLSHETYAGRVDGECVCVFGLGVGSILASVARPWMLGTEGLRRHRYAFLRHNRAMVEGWRERWDLLENWADARNTDTLKWLRWLGFSVEEAKPFGPFGMPFHRFSMRR